MVRLLGEVFVVDVLDRFTAAQEPQDGGARVQVGRWDKENAVETSGAAKSRVEMPGCVRGGQDQDPVVAALDPVELGQELVDQLAPAAGAKVGPAGRQGIHLVEEQHAGGILSRLVEKRVQVSLAVADPHLEHVVDPDRQEPRVNLAGGCSSQVGLAAARRPDTAGCRRRSTCRKPGKARDGSSDE